MIESLGQSELTYSYNRKKKRGHHGAIHLVLVLILECREVLGEEATSRANAAIQGL